MAILAAVGLALVASIAASTVYMTSLGAACYGGIYQSKSVTFSSTHGTLSIQADMHRIVNSRTCSIRDYADIHTISPSYFTFDSSASPDFTGEFLQINVPSSPLPFGQLNYAPSWVYVSGCTNSPTLAGGGVNYYWVKYGADCSQLDQSGTYTNDFQTYLWSGTGYPYNIGLTLTDCYIIIGCSSTSQTLAMTS